MTPVGRPVEEDDLHARIDGQLPHDRAEDVDVYLAAHPEEQARFSQYAVQRQALREAFAEQVDEPIPSRLRITNLRARQRQRRLRHGRKYCDRLRLRLSTQACHVARGRRICRDRLQLPQNQR